MYHSRSQTIPAPYYQIVSTTEDIIFLRQQVRARARELGLTLLQQAKITTVVGTMAEAVRQKCLQVTWMVRVLTEQGRQTLEVTCVVADKQGPSDSAWNEVLPLTTIRHLVAETRTINQLGQVMISLRERVPIQKQRNLLRTRVVAE